MLVSDSGQATAEYALVIVAAAVVAVALITWASSSDLLPAFFTSILERVRGMAGA
jgi:Flp pilus assembly pilin Flp